MKKKFFKLQAKYIKSIIDIVNLFAEKEGLDCKHWEDFYFVAANVVNLNENYLSLDDIFYDLANGIKKGKLLEYNDLVHERFNKDLDSVSYPMWLERKEIDPDKAKEKAPFRLVSLEERKKYTKKLKRLQKELNELAGKEVDLGLFLDKKIWN